MPQIKLLDQQTIDKIAAGEVVDRPSSVVKELVENAIDAKATAVTIEIKDGGKSLIRITDNGYGIEKDQIAMAFQRHSTSKIHQVTDLLTIHSLGFRGEALSSIAAVSQVEVITKPVSQLIGCRYQIEGGVEKKLEEIGAPNGTTFLVRNLFYNTPARQKFLRTAQTEAGYIASLVERLALSHPEISFKFINNRQMKLNTSGNGNLKDVIYSIYGRDVTANLLEISHAADDFEIAGYIGKPIISRGNRNFENYFINGRYIKSKLLSKAIEDAYKGFLMQHRYPFTVLQITMDGRRIDVNVHPSKMELRFSQPDQLYDSLSSLLHTVLKQQELIPEVSIRDKKPAASGSEEKKRAIQAPEPFEEKRLEKIRQSIRRDSPYEPKYPHKKEHHGDMTVNDRPDSRHMESPGKKSTGVSHQTAASQKYRKNTGHLPAASPADRNLFEETQNSRKVREQSVRLADKIRHPDPSSSSETQTRTENPPDKQKKADENRQLSFDKFLSQDARKDYRIIGQLFETYWLIEYKDQFYMIDQHAAHEKVMFERLMKAYHTKKFSSQMITPPVILNLSMQEYNRMSRYLPCFEKLGFEIEPFGGESYAIRGVPADLYSLNAKDLFLSLLDQLSELPEKDAPDMVVEKIASMSCKAAVKGSSKLSRPEAEALLDELMQLDNPYFCPHGRPVIISMSKYEIDKKFKRIV